MPPPEPRSRTVSPSRSSATATGLPQPRDARSAASGMPSRVAASYSSRPYVPEMSEQQPSPQQPLACAARPEPSIAVSGGRDGRAATSGQRDGPLRGLGLRGCARRGDGRLAYRSRTCCWISLSVKLRSVAVWSVTVWLLSWIRDGPVQGLAGPTDRGYAGQLQARRRRPAAGDREPKSRHQAARARASTATRGSRWRCAPRGARARGSGSRSSMTARPVT